MTGNPWTKWFWSDWEGDKKLQMCSLAAQGLWMRMLCICAEADPVGYLMVNGRGVTMAGLAKLVGHPEEEVSALVDELEINGVFYRDRNRNIYNRRMVKTEKARKDNQVNGAEGGKASLRNKRGIFAPLGKDDERQSERTAERPAEQLPEHDSEPHGRKPEARSQKEKLKEAPQLSGNELIVLGNRCLEAFGISPSEFMGHFGSIRDVLAIGCTPDEVVEICRRIAARPNFTPRGNPIALLSKAARDEYARLLTERREDGPKLPQADVWAIRLAGYRDSKVWSSMWGPKPGEPGCECPAAILAEFGYGGTP